jgi:transposase
VVADLREVIARLVADNRQLVADNRALVTANRQLTARVEELEAELGRNSQNSGKPPSSDSVTERAAQNAKRRSQRRPSPRKPGKQPGSEGKHLARVEHPDHVAVHRPQACGGCGAGLDSGIVVGWSSRQVFDLPEVRLQVTEHRAQTLRCGCGHDTTAAFPEVATAPTCYGPNVVALAVYLLYRQHLPVARTAELLAAVVGAPVSTGWLAGLGERARLRLRPFMALLARLLADAGVVHVDETGARIAGTRWWFHTVCTSLLSLIICHPKRGHEACDAAGVLPDFNGTAVHDGWQPYWRYKQCRHALCGAHLLRDLASVAEIPGQQKWATAMADLLVEAKLHLDDARLTGRSGMPWVTLCELRTRYEAIIVQGLKANPEPLRGRPRSKRQREAVNLLRRLDEQDFEVQASWVDLAVPFDNNTAERDLRMVKLQQKISGCFRTSKAAEAFCAVRSYLQTAAKHDQNQYDVLVQLFTNGPWLPSHQPAT